MPWKTAADMAAFLCEKILGYGLALSFEKIAHLGDARTGFSYENSHL
jgi:hypothetical protein